MGSNPSPSVCFYLRFLRKNFVFPLIYKVFFFSLLLRATPWLRCFGSPYRNRNLSSKSNFGLPPSGYCSVWNISNETGTPVQARFADLLAWNEIIDSRRIKTAFAIFYLIRDAAAENLSRCALAAQDTPQAFGELLG